MEYPQEHARSDRRALIEFFDRDGRVARSVSVHDWPLTLGRALDNDVVLDDPYVAPRHATLEADERGRVSLAVGDTLNGAWVGSVHHGAGTRVVMSPAGELLQLGGVKMRLRLPAEVLAPERRLPAAAGSTTAGAVAAGLLVMLVALGGHWLALDPGADATAWLPVVVWVPLALAAWCGIWALVSKLFQHRFDFLGHLRIVLPWLLGIELAGTLVPLVAAAWAWPTLWRLAQPLQAVLAVLMLRAHLRHVLPLSGRTVTAVLAGAAMVAATISLTLTQRATDRYSRPAYMSTLPMPALRLSGTSSPAELIQEMEPLAARLAQRVKEARADEEDEREAGSD